MRSPILQIAQDAADDLSLHRPDTLFANPHNDGDSSDRKLLRHLMKTLRFLANTYGWQVLRAEHTFTTSSTHEQPASALPADFLDFIQDSMFDRTRRWKIIGPINSEEYQYKQAHTTVNTSQYFYMRGDTMFMTDDVQVGHEIFYEYKRDAIGKDTSGEWIKRLTDDADVPLWDDELVTLGVINNYRKAEELDTSVSQFDFERMLADRVKMDGGRSNLYMGMPQKGNVPDGLWPFRVSE